MKNLISQKGITAKEVCGRMAKYKSSIDKDTAGILRGIRADLKKMGIDTSRGVTDEVLENFSELLCRTIQKDPSTEETIGAVVKDIIRAKVPISFAENFIFGFKDILVPYLQKEFSEHYYDFFNAQKIIDAALRRIWVTAISEYYHQTTRSTEEKEERWHSLVENAPDIIMMVGHDGTIKFINRTVSSFSVEKTIGTTVYDYTPPEYRKTLKSSIERVFRTGRPTNYESAGAGPDGSVSWYSTTVGPIKNMGKVTNVILISRDVTDQKGAEERTKESEETFRSIFENAGDGILVADTEKRRFLMANKKICRMLGYSEKELLKLDVSKIHPKRDLPNVVKAFKLQAQKKLNVTRGLPVLRKDGTVFYADISSGPFVLKGKKYLMGFFRPVGGM